MSDPQSTPHEAETQTAPSRGPYLGVEHLVQRGAAAHQPVHERQPQAQRAVIDGLHEDDLRQDQQRVPHVAAELARHAGPRGPAATWGLGQRCRAMDPGPPWHLRGHTPGLSQQAVPIATPPRPGGGTGLKGRAHSGRGGRGGADRPIPRVRENPAHSSCSARPSAGSFGAHSPVTDSTVEVSERGPASPAGSPNSGDRQDHGGESLPA